MSDFVMNIEQIRERARQEIDKGPITEAYGADLDRVLQILNEVLATELVCVLRYKQHYYASQGLQAAPVAAEFLQHAAEEQMHADTVADRISVLGGVPDFNPATLVTRSHAEYATAATLVEMIKEDLVAERIAIVSYAEISRWLGDGDPTSRNMIETILAKEEEHADDLRSLLIDLGKA